MSNEQSRTSKDSSRRKFLLAAGATGAATIAMPQVSRAQTVTWKYQSTWPTKDIFHEFAVDYAKKVNDMSGGRLKLDVLAAGAVVPAFQLQDAVHSGVLDGGHGVTAYWYGKNKVASLFGTPPSMGWDAHSMLGWFYYGGGEQLYNELINDILKINTVGFLYYPMPTQPLGWFKKPSHVGDDFKNLKYRTVGLSADLFKEMGAAVTILSGGEIVPAHGPRPARRGGIQQPVLRPPARLPRRVQGLHGAAATTSSRNPSRSASTRPSSTRFRPS